MKKRGMLTMVLASAMAVSTLAAVPAAERPRRHRELRCRRHPGGERKGQTHPFRLGGLGRVRDDPKGHCADLQDPGAAVLPPFPGGGHHRGARRPGLRKRGQPGVPACGREYVNDQKAAVLQKAQPLFYQRRFFFSPSRRWKGLSMRMISSPNRWTQSQGM